MTNLHPLFQQILRPYAPPPVDPTPEVIQWLAECGIVLNADLDRRVRNAIIYGTSHPEMYIAYEEPAA